MTVDLIGDDRTASLRDRNAMEGGGRRLSWTARNANAGRRGRKGAMPLRENDRGAAALRSDMSNRGRVGRAHFLCPNGWQQWPHRSFGNLPGQCDKSGERRRTFRVDGGSGFSIGHMSPMLARIRKHDLLLMRNALGPVAAKLARARTEQDRLRFPPERSIRAARIQILGAVPKDAPKREGRYYTASLVAQASALG